jgi:tripartite-type tricarboxylate transporter receptor subunit TctC
MRAILKAFALALIGWAATTLPVAQAQPYPSKPIRMIVPWPPGGGTDIVGRTLANKLSELMGQQVFVENRAGAAAIIGTEAAAKAPADGYTLLMGNVGPNAANAGLYKSLPYDVIKDFAPISLVGTAPYMMVVHTSVPAKSAKEFIELAKREPGKLNYGTGGIGSAPHLAAVLLSTLADIKMEHIPYKGGSAHTAALLAGEVQLTLNTALELLPHVRAGKLRALAVTSKERYEGAPEVPTLIESGVPGYEFFVWWGLYAPAGTPVDIQEKLNQHVIQALQASDVRERLAKLGVTVVGSSRQAFAEFTSAEVLRWTKVARDANLPQQ